MREATDAQRLAARQNGLERWRSTKGQALIESAAATTRRAERFEILVFKCIYNEVVGKVAAPRSRNLQFLGHRRGTPCNLSLLRASAGAVSMFVGSLSMLLPPVVAVALSAFVSAAAYSIAFPTVSPFLNELGSAASNTTTTAAVSPLLGIACALPSLTKIPSAVLIGEVATRVGIRLPFIACSMLCVASGVLYACAQSAVWVLAARAILGMATCNSSLCRAWVAQQSGGSNERARLTSVVTAATTLGFIGGPLVVRQPVLTQT